MKTICVAIRCKRRYKYLEKSRFRGRTNRKETDFLSPWLSSFIYQPYWFIQQKIDYIMILFMYTRPLFVWSLSHYSFHLGWWQLRSMNFLLNLTIKAAQWRKVVPSHILKEVFISSSFCSSKSLRPASSFLPPRIIITLVTNTVKQVSSHNPATGYHAHVL